MKSCTAVVDCRRLLDDCTQLAVQDGSSSSRNTCRNNVASESSSSHSSSSGGGKQPKRREQAHHKQQKSPHGQQKQLLLLLLLLLLLFRVYCFHCDGGALGTFMRAVIGECQQSVTWLNNPPGKQLPSLVGSRVKQTEATH